MSADNQICPVCGNSIPEGTEKCPYCGTVQSDRLCPACGQHIFEQAARCPYCGHNMDNNRNQSGLKTILVVLIFLLMAGLIVGAFVRKHNNKESDTKDVPVTVPVTEVPNWTDEPVESKSTELEPTRSEESETASVGDAYEQLLSSGSYTEVLESVLALDPADMGAEVQKELADILSRAADGQYSQFEESMNRLQNAGDYDGALAAVDDEVHLYNRIVDHSLAQQYVDLQWPLAEKRAEIMRSHISYLLDMGKSDAVQQWDETGLNNNILDRLQGYVDEGMMTQEQYDIQRAIIYGKFVNGKIAFMGDQGTDASSILKFIVRKIGDTGYNCQVIEYWDFYMSVIGKGAGDPALVSARSADGYLLKGSNSRKLISEDYTGLSRDELRLAIFEIYARHGYEFQDRAVNKYFKNYAWYQADSSYKGEDLNEYEQSNLATLVEYMFGKYR